MCYVVYSVTEYNKILVKHTKTHNSDKQSLVHST